MNTTSSFIPHPSSFDVAIVGAGIVGAACARECALQGLRVAVIERDVIGGGATAEGMGHIVVMDDSEAQFALTRYSQLLWHELAAEWPATAEYEQCGTLWVAADEEEMAEVYRKRDFYGARGVAPKYSTLNNWRRPNPICVQVWRAACLCPVMV
jgi:glycine/D-amino acid oxidase-like deaminating enzyme